jgi:tetratricopeptide (TPR) repeat protein
LKRHNAIIYTTLAVLAVAALSAFLLLKQKNGGNEFIQSIRNNNKNDFDAMNETLAKENALYALIENTIDKKEYETANALIDSLCSLGETHMVFVFRGMIYASQKDYRGAIEQYSTAIQREKYSKGLAKRAEAYAKLNELDSAIADYKAIIVNNHFFNLPLAETFLLKRQRDSALKYYLIYSESYPYDSAILQKITLLKKGG